MLSLKENSKNLGEIVLGESVEFDFTLVNDSNVYTDFTIHLSCGSCTEIIEKKDQDLNGIDPKSEKTITAKFSPKVSGRQIKTISIFIKEVKVATLHFSAYVKDN